MILIVPLKEREIYTPILPSEVIGTCVGHHGAKRDKDVEQITITAEWQTQSGGQVAQNVIGDAPLTIKTTEGRSANTPLKALLLFINQTMLAIILKC